MTQGPKNAPTDASKRESFFDTRMSGGNMTWQNRTGKMGSTMSNRTSPDNKMFTKTVTNFAQVRYDDNGGLNP